MKITKSQVQQIIREELANVMSEETEDHREDHNIDDLWAMVRNLRREVDTLRDRHGK
jgi:ubiquinone biosynthesis protein UbiJ